MRHSARVICPDSAILIPPKSQATCVRTKIKKNSQLEDALRTKKAITTRMEERTCVLFDHTDMMCESEVCRGVRSCVDRNDGDVQTDSQFDRRVDDVVRDRHEQSVHFVLAAERLDFGRHFQVQNISLDGFEAIQFQVDLEVGRGLVGGRVHDIPERVHRFGVQNACDFEPEYKYCNKYCRDDAIVIHYSTE